MAGWKVKAASRVAGKAAGCFLSPIMVLFMQAARWVDDIRNSEKQHRALWRYINWPFNQTAYNKLETCAGVLNRDC